MMQIKRLAMTAALLTFFTMVIVGLYVGQSAFSVTLRSVIGAVVAYVAAALALRMCVEVLIRAVVETAPPPSDEDEEELTSEATVEQQ